MLSKQCQLRQRAVVRQSCPAFHLHQLYHCKDLGAQPPLFDPSAPLQCFHAAGVPPGVLNCVTGRGSEIGDYLTTHPGANCISFTGGDTGIDICRKAGMVPVQVGAGWVLVGGVRVEGWGVVLGGVRMMVVVVGVVAAKLL